MTTLAASIFDKVTNVCSWCSNAAAVQVLIPLAVAFAFWFTFLKSRQSKGEPPLPPGPRGLPIVGYLPFLGSDLRWSFKDLADVYGPIFKVRLGIKDFTVVTSPSLVKEVLKDQDAIFANRNPTITSSLATFGATDVALSDPGPEWRKMKKIFVSDLLSNASLDASYYLRKKQVKKMISRAYEKDGESVDVGELTFLTMLNFIMSMVWGETMKGDDDGAVGAEFRSVVSEFMLALGAPNVSDFLPFLARFDLQGIRRRMKSAAEQVDKIFDMAIDHASAAAIDSQKDFLGFLLQLTKQEDPATSLTLPQVKAILMNALIGGMDTTATTAEWAMAELLRHPKVMKNVQEELTETIGSSSTVEEAHLPQLNYLNAVLKETLRLHPPVPFLVPHRGSKKTTLGGYSLPENSVVFCNIWAIQRDPEIWQNPLEFQPQRFLHASEKTDFLSLGKEFQYLPFGSGRRMCPGMSLAEKMAMYILASLLHVFEWALPNGTEDVDVSEIFGLVPKKTKPLIAVPSARFSNLELYSHV